MQIRPIGADFVAEITDIDLRQPLSAEQVQTIDRTMDRYAVVVFPKQELDDDPRTQLQALLFLAFLSPHSQESRRSQK